MKLAYAKRLLVDAAVSHAKRATGDVARLAVEADTYLERVKKTSKARGYTVLYAAATHLLISRSAGTTYKQLRAKYPKLPASQPPLPDVSASERRSSPPDCNTGVTSTVPVAPDGSYAVVRVNGEDVSVFDVLMGYV